MVDSAVMEKDFVYTGGGSSHSLVKISPKEMLRLNKAQIVRVRK